MSETKTVLAPGAPWPKPEDWPVQLFTLRQKPVRVITPKKRKLKTTTKPFRRYDLLCEVVLDGNIFKHPKENT